MPDHSVKYLHMVAHGSRDPDGQLEYIGAIQDVTQRRLSEATLGKVRSELAHVARVTSLGVLTASIAHEVSQPLSGIVTNAATCLRMLNAAPPTSMARVKPRCARFAMAVVRLMLSHDCARSFAKRTAANESVDLNEAYAEVIALSLSELQRNRVIVRENLAEDLPSVIGDRVSFNR